MDNARSFDAPFADPRPAAPPEVRPSGGINWLAPIATVLVVLALAPLAAVGWYQYEHAGRVFRGVSALGVDLGGMTAEQARGVLDERARTLTARPVLVQAGEFQWPTDWGRLGVRLDVAPVVEQAMAVGREGDPLRRVRAQIDALREGTAIPAAETIDRPALDRFVETAVAQVDRPMRDARLDMRDDLTFELTSAVVGRRLDADEARRRLLAGADAGADRVDLPVELIQPRTTDEMRLATKRKAEAIVAAPFVMQHGDDRWTIERRDLAEMLVFSGGPGVPLDVTLDTSPLLPRLQKIAAEMTQEPSDARLEWTGSGVRATTPSREGRTMDPNAALKLVAEAVERGERSVALPVTVARPRVDSNRLGELGIRELVETASTSFAGSVPQKAHNVRLAASRLHGHVIAPGETFSFNKALGPTTIDNGYQVAFGITSGNGQAPKTVPSVAGGICQVATTIFQPLFWAGYQLEERHWHLYWIPAYASKGVVGLDATVDEEAGLDLQFVNNSPTFLLIQSKVEGTTLTFDLYGTKPSWTVKVDGPTISNQKPPDTTPVVEPEPSLPEGERYVVESAREGFTATFVRTVTDQSGGVRTLKLESRYAPSRNVTLVGTGGRQSAPRGGSEQNRPTPSR